MKDLPLLDLFTKLRSAGLPLGVDDYQAVLRSLQGGYGLTDRVALARVCRMLWVRSADEQQLFDHYFEQVIGSDISSELEISAEKTNTAQRIMVQSVVFRKKHLKPGWIKDVLVLVTGLGLVSGVMFTVVRWTPPEASVSIPAPAKPAQPLPPIQPKTVFNQDFQMAQTGLFIGFMLGAGLIGAGIVWLLRNYQVFERFQPHPQPVAPPLKSANSTKNIPTLLRDLNDEVAIAQAVQQTAPGGRSYAVAQDYLPVTQRQLKQSWRYLRQLVREGIATELDIEATTQQIARCGMLLEPVVVPPRQNRTELLLLVDQDGSMVAFRSLAERLTETAVRGGRLGKMGIFYFRNCPIDSLYRDPLHLDAEPVADVLAQLRRDRTVVLIFSDGGAARGGFSRDRIDVTAEFLAKLESQVRRVVWLNPMPQSRWAGTTASEIARSVPMFEATRQGIEGAIGTLRGRYHGKVQRGGDRA